MRHKTPQKDDEMDTATADFSITDLRHTAHPLELLTSIEQTKPGSYVIVTPVMSRALMEHLANLTKDGEMKPEWKTADAPMKVPVSLYLNGTLCGFRGTVMGRSLYESSSRRYTAA